MGPVLDSKGSPSDGSIFDLQLVYYVAVKMAKEAKRYIKGRSRDLTMVFVS